MIVRKISKPNVQISHVSVFLCVVCNVIHHHFPHGGIGHTNVGQKGIVLVQLALAADLRHVLQCLDGRFSAALPVAAITGLQTEGIARPAVTHSVILQTALGDLCFAPYFPLQNLLGLHGLGNTVFVVESVLVVGIVVEKGNYQELKNAIMEVAEKGKEHYIKACIEKSKNYDMKARFNDYIDLYEEILKQ